MRHGKLMDYGRNVVYPISSMGVSFGTLTLTPATAYILQHFSWKTGFVFIGFSLLIPGILIAQLLMCRTVPEAYGLKPDGEDPEATQLDCCQRSGVSRASGLCQKHSQGFALLDSGPVSRHRGHGGADGLCSPSALRH
jgi:hypothetical protein